MVGRRQAHGIFLTLRGEFLSISTKRKIINFKKISGGIKVEYCYRTIPRLLLGQSLLQQARPGVGALHSGRLLMVSIVLYPLVLRVTTRNMDALTPVLSNLDTMCAAMCFLPLIVLILDTTCFLVYISDECFQDV